MTGTKDDEAVIRSVLADAPIALIIAELERRGWERGWVSVGAETYDMLCRARDEGPVPFQVDLEADFGDEALSA
jgi:hypothetical protein